MHYGLVEAGEGVLSYQDLTRQDVEYEATGMYLCRVLVRQYPLPSATLLWKKRENAVSLTLTLVRPVNSADKLGQCVAEFLH